MKLHNSKCLRSQWAVGIWSLTEVLSRLCMSKNGCFRSCTNLEALHILQGMYIPYIQYFPCTSKTWTYVNVFVRIRSCFGRTPAFMPGAPKFWIFLGQKIPGTNGVQARNSKFWTYMNVLRFHWCTSIFWTCTDVCLLHIQALNVGLTNTKHRRKPEVGMESGIIVLLIRTKLDGWM